METLVELQAIKALDVKMFYLVIISVSNGILVRL